MRVFSGQEANLGKSQKIMIPRLDPLPLQLNTTHNLPGENAPRPFPEIIRKTVTAILSNSHTISVCSPIHLCPPASFITKISHSPPFPISLLVQMMAAPFLFSPLLLLTAHLIPPSAPLHSKHSIVSNTHHQNNIWSVHPSSDAATCVKEV